MKLPPVRSLEDIRARCVERDGCWEWTMQKVGNNYGRVSFFGKMWLAHRLAWVMAVGDPGDLDVCHRCDNPCCCNPGHLFLGTHRENMQDAARKGRMRPPKLRGSRHPQAKLTEDQVAEIRRRRAAGEGCVALAREFGVASSGISNITARKIWGHVN